MQRSASPDHTTSQVRRPTKWEMPGLAKLGICAMGFGVIALAGVIIDGHDSTGVDTLSMSFLAVGVTLICGGLETIRWGISAQKGTRREELFVDDLFAIEQSQNAMTDSLTKFVAAGTAQADRSREARERLERMERVLIAVDAKLADAEAFGQHLVDLADRMEALEKRQEEMLNLAVARADADKTALDSMFEQLREDLREAVKEAKAAGYVHGVDRRVNGSRGALQLVDPER